MGKIRYGDCGRKAASTVGNEPYSPDELAQPIENFKSIYRRAKKEGLHLKAHVGEWGSAEDVRRAVEELDSIRLNGLKIRKPEI